MLVDIHSDKDQEVLVKIASEFPAIAQRLSSIDDLELEDEAVLSDSAFAWPEERLFPIYTKEASLVSSAYLEGADVPLFVKEACISACSAFGVEVQIDALEKVASAEVTLNASDYVLPGRSKLPVVDADSYARSEGIFLNNLDDFSFDEIVVGARQLVKKASDMNLESNSKLDSLSMSGSMDIGRAVELSKSRYSATADSAYLNVSDKLAGLEYNSIEKIAEWAVEMDGLDSENGISDPVSLFYPMNDGDKIEAMLIGSEEIPLEKIASIDASEWLDIADRDTVEFLFANGELNTDELSNIIKEASAEECDMIESFIQYKTRN